jgi:FKBP-type peptidyl-prolyl cis-trans isomerase SlyD
MEITTQKVVTIDYTLTDDQGEVIESNVGGQSLAYLHGVGALIPGLEEALEGHRQGDTVEVTVPPEKAYGPRSDDMIQRVPKERFNTDRELEIGMQFQARSEHGMQILTIKGIEGDQVTVDANHPLAGQTLRFEVAIREVREATEEERTHGHVHGPGGHQH